MIPSRSGAANRECGTRAVDHPDQIGVLFGGGGFAFWPVHAQRSATGTRYPPTRSERPMPDSRMAERRLWAANSNLRQRNRCNPVPGFIAPGAPIIYQRLRHAAPFVLLVCNGPSWRCHRSHGASPGAAFFTELKFPRLNGQCPRSRQSFF
jgi:hypothetical protein